MKEYKDVRGEQGDPLADSELCRDLLVDCWGLLAEAGKVRPGLLDVYRSCLEGGTGQFLEALGGVQLPGPELVDRVVALADGRACPTMLRRVLPSLVSDRSRRPAVAYALAWLTVVGTESVLPHWVHHRYRDVGALVRKVRGSRCADPRCRYCAEHHNVGRSLKRFFGFDGFRRSPTTATGLPLQERLTDHVNAGRPVLGVMPTGVGKSLCYQLPAILNNQQTGALTVVFSPLQALMKDQVEQLRKRTRTPSFAATLNGLQTLLERRDTLEGVRLGRFALLYVAPEQLRSPAFGRTLRHREIAAWVFDEAHCLSQWGHDFRPDYLYAGRFIREFSEREGVPPAPVACFTATATVAVQQDLCRYFRRELDTELTVLSGEQIDRANLRYTVEQLPTAQKEPRIDALLRERIGGGSSAGPHTGSAIVYARSRLGTERIADGLRQRGWDADHFHAGLEPPAKQAIQKRFIDGDLPVIVATNAFGMGIDKDDVRVVIHADVPGSIENYLQEAGRGGRDGKPADCVLLYNPGDLERQFDLVSRSELTKRDLAQILRAVRRHRRGDREEIIVSPADLLRVPEMVTSFDPEGHDAATQVKVAISWLERTRFVLRDENRTRLFQGVPATRDAAASKMDALDLSRARRGRWEATLEVLRNADDRDGIDIDHLASLPPYRRLFKSLERRYGDNPRLVNEAAEREIFRNLYDMGRAGVLEEGTYFSAFLSHKVAGKAAERLDRVAKLERYLLNALLDAYRDLGAGSETEVSVGWLLAALRERDVAIETEDLLKLVDGWARGGFSARTPITVKSASRATIRIGLDTGWAGVEDYLKARRSAARSVVSTLEAVADRQDPNKRGERLVLFSLHELGQRLDERFEANGPIPDTFTAVEKTLLFLDEQQVIKLQHGLSMFRQAMTLRVVAETGRRYTNREHQKLTDHYAEKVLKVHAIGRYVDSLAADPDGAAGRYISNYFKMPPDAFRQRYFPTRVVTERATSEASYQHIVNDLGNRAQQRIVTAPKGRNTLVLAGPGSGKTRVVVHRCAYLLKVERVRPERILVICFNRSAMYELRSRIRALVGADLGRRVAIHTYHSLALRLCERSLAAERLHLTTNPANLPHRKAVGDFFNQIIDEANQRLRGDQTVEGRDADDLRDRLLAGFEQVLVDEYQDIDDRQYEMLAHIARKAGHDEDRYAAVLAVGDDDQSIYGFRGANTAHIERFGEDFDATPEYLVENYRSTRHIIEAANGLIAHNKDRMKGDHPIRINAARRRPAADDKWAARRVVVGTATDPTAANASITERIERMTTKDNTALGYFAVFSTTHSRGHLVRAYLEDKGIPVRRVIDDGLPWLWRIREFRLLLDHLATSPHQDIRIPDLRAQLPNITSPDPHTFGTQTTVWTMMAARLLTELQQDLGSDPCPPRVVSEALYQALSEQKRSHFIGEGVTVCTVHAAKGLEFDHVVVTDGGWQRVDQSDDPEATRRLLYVAMTRAKSTLSLLERVDAPNPYLPELPAQHIDKRRCATVDSPKTHTHSTYTVLGMADLDLSYAGAHPAHSAIHREISRLSAGNPINLDKTPKGDVLVKTPTGRPIGRLSKAAAKRWDIRRLATITAAPVLALVERTGDEGDLQYLDRLRTDRWEIPLIEVKQHTTPPVSQPQPAQQRTTERQLTPLPPDATETPDATYCDTCTSALAEWATELLAGRNKPPPTLHPGCGTQPRP
ncbi:MAG: RecQ family ATP-dependent DNA helicase [Acidimicrobiia bacterium]|nr:RecQ family ATP-dependent DNA helicase [Acidimicrobiia bacterium]